MKTLNEHQGESWKLYNGDSAEVLKGLPSNSADLAVFSPPFSSLYTYSNSERDLGNCRSHAEFFEHFQFATDELLRVMKPARLACVHVQQLATTKASHGVMGMYDFRGDVIRHFIEGGWIYHGEVCIDKDPQAVACRTKKTSLMFVTKRRDSAVLSPCFADYVCIFRKPGDNDAPIQHMPDGEVTDEDWIRWARPVWYGIEETRVLNTEVARGNEDERHLCPLSLDTIERCVKLWSNKGEIVLSPFAGIGSEGYGAILAGRRFVGIELKESYYRTACENLRRAERMAQAKTLFSDIIEVDDEMEVMCDEPA